MQFESIRTAPRYLRSYQQTIETMLEHFNAVRTVRGSGIKDGSCCAVTLDTATPVYGNSQAFRTDGDATLLGSAHAEVVAYQLVEDGQCYNMFCELSPCNSCRRTFEELGEGRILYLYEYPGQIQQWKDFHNQPIDEQKRMVRREAGLLR